MHFKGLDLNLLVALDALLSEQSVTRAADRLCVTQPAMSMALRKLRDHTDDELLRRSGRQLELTPCGEALRRPVRELLSQIDDILSTPRRPPGGGARRRLVAQDAT